MRVWSRWLGNGLQNRQRGFESRHPLDRDFLAATATAVIGILRMRPSRQMTNKRDSGGMVTAPCIRSSLQFRELAHHRQG